MSLRWKTLPAAAAALVFISLSHAENYGPDPDRVMGVTLCNDCHVSSVAAWQATHHFASFEVNKQEPEKVKAIQDALGLKGPIRRQELCQSCHFTMKSEQGRASAISGVSCEACHGAAGGTEQQEWMKFHSDLKPDNVERKDVAPDERKARLEGCVKRGMILPTMTYELARNCFECHTVPEENLVNVGGHDAGSPIELVTWSQGEVRHNFLADNGTETHPEDKTNRETSAERKRVLYVVGQAVDLEMSLRALAKATGKGKFADAQVQRVQAARKSLEAIQKAVPGAPLKDLLAGLDKVQLEPGHASLAGAADAAATSAKALAVQAPDSLAAVDALIPTEARGNAFTPP